MAHPDFDRLLNALLPFAQQMLKQHGEFLPFGASMNTDGKISAQAVHDGDEHPPAQHVIDSLKREFRAMAESGSIRAAGICYDVRTIPPGQAEKTDAICLSLEHRDGDASDAYMPYKKRWLGGIRYADMYAFKRERAFFP